MAPKKQALNQFIPVERLLRKTINQWNLGQGGNKNQDVQMKNSGEPLSQLTKT